ncbi:hypothetical protein [Rathayibacter oskolensis]
MTPSSPPAEKAGRPSPRYTRGVLAKYAKLVRSAAVGATTG